MREIADPKVYIHGWRFLNIGVLLQFWMLGDPTVASFILILLLLVMTSLRWRFRLPLWTVLVDVVVCLLYFPVSEISYFGLALPIFELALRGKWAFSLLPFAAMLFFSAASSLLFWYYLQALFFGVFSSITLKNQQQYKQEADEQRQARYELERIKAELLEESKAVSHQAELMERYRISRDLHDHLGHDLTGASLALQAYEYAEDRREAEQLLAEAKERIANSMKSLRETVHNMTPTALIGVENLEHIVQNFSKVPVQFRKAGNMPAVQAHIWALLEACLKEALTNVARHSNATQVEANLQVTHSIVRLSIQDNGTVAHEHPPGSGLRSLQMRSRALGGSLSISREGGFLCVCVIPLEKGGSE